MHKVDKKSKMPMDNSIVLFSSGKWQIELTGGGLVVTDGWVSNWIICYGDGKWAGDNYVETKALKNWLYKNCDRFAK